MENRKYTLIVVLSLLLFLPASGQVPDTISLYECYKLVRVNAPQLGLLNIYQQTTDIENQKLSAKNLPQVTGYGKAWYQSDAVTVTMPIPGMSGLEIDKFQYNAGINIDQKLLDGGLNVIQKRIKTIEGDIGQLETEVALYKLNELANAYFFGIIRLKESVKVLNLKHEILKERRKVVESGVENGAILETELERLNSEVAITNQQIAELRLGYVKLENSLSILTGREGKATEWVLPQSIASTDSLNRNETHLYESNRKYLESLKDIQGRKYIPQVYAFGQAGYSYPGLNFFENQSDVYYMVGAKLSWRIFDWSEGKKEKQLIDLKRSQIDIAEANFNRNLSISIVNQNQEIEMLNELLENDKVIISSKERIAKASASSLDNGTLTSADYLNDLNAELKARIDFEVHRVKLFEAQAKLAVLKGIHIQ